jgi:hypothetical protein
MSFPIRGIIPTVCLIIAAILTIVIGEAALGIDPGTLSVFTLFATWFAFILSTGGGWPLQKANAAVRGFIFLAISLIYGYVHMWAQPLLFGFSADFYWPLIANLFLAIGITIAFDNKLVSGLKPLSAMILNILFWYLFAFALLYMFPHINGGMIPAIWFAWFVFYFFWMERHPIANMPQPAKGILSFVVMVACGVLLNNIFRWFFDTGFFNPDAGFWFASWVFWLVITSWVFDTWPFDKIKQPLKGLAGLVLTVALATATFCIVSFGTNLSMGEAGSYTWIFICWAYIWPICFGKWPAKVPAPEPEPIEKAEAE